MRTKLAALFGALAVCALVAAPALAGDHTQPGIPGTANCAGQSAAFLAQEGKNAGIQDARGIGQLEHYLGVTNKDVQTAIAEYCAGP
jgi:hypothetical protein